MKEIKFIIDYGNDNEVFQAALQIRNTVFVEEQKFSPTLEVDSQDKTAFHIVGFDNTNNLVCCARFFKLGDEYWVGRVAVLKPYRQQGIAKELMTEIEDYLKNVLKAKSLRMHAQMSAQAFYQKCGYTSYGAIELDEGVEHIKMQKTWSISE